MTSFHQALLIRQTDRVTEVCPKLARHVGAEPRAGFASLLYARVALYHGFPRRRRCKTVRRSAQLLMVYLDVKVKTVRSDVRDALSDGNGRCRTPHGARFVTFVAV
mgnify:CR=1 FL=1